jgi:energy-coupling factor transporter ATP-binding protein EcfA2
MTGHEHDEGLAPVEWVLLVPTAAIWMVNGLAGFLLFTVFVGYAVYRQNPDAFAGLLDAPARRLTSHTRGTALTTASSSHEPEALAEPVQDVFDLLTSDRHVLIVGHTGGGKSTLLHALAARQAQAKASVLVIDVDSIAGRYPGYRVVGSGDDYEAASAGLVIVKRELQKRREARRAGATSFSRMVLLIDEMQDVVRELDTAWDIVEDIIRRGRKVNIFVVIAAQDSQVRTLKLESKSALLGNLTRVDVKRSGRQRVAHVGHTTYPLPALKHPDELVHAVRGGPVRTSPAEDTSPAQSAALLSELLAASPAQSEGQSDQSSDPVQRSRRDQSRDEPDWGDIAAAYVRLGSKNKVWEWLRDSYGVRRKETAYALIDEALAKQERARRAGDSQADDDASQADNDDDPPPAFGWLGV